MSCAEAVRKRSVEVCGEVFSCLCPGREEQSAAKRVACLDVEDLDVACRTEATPTVSVPENIARIRGICWLGGSPDTYVDRGGEFYPFRPKSLPQCADDCVFY